MGKFKEGELVRIDSIFDVEKILQYMDVEELDYIQSVCEMLKKRINICKASEV